MSGIGRFRKDFNEMFLEFYEWLIKRRENEKNQKIKDIYDEIVGKVRELLVKYIKEVTIG